ncbi:MAG TPA: rubredoxin [Methanocorpusculum sp.]|nr:rubredoxin [Methanocorpusculum sp.]
MTKYICSICGYVYDSEKGAGFTVPAGTEFDALPASWVCPTCGADKGRFLKQG